MPSAPIPDEPELVLLGVFADEFGAATARMVVRPGLPRSDPRWWGPIQARHEIVDIHDYGVVEACGVISRFAARSLRGVPPPDVVVSVERDHDSWTVPAPIHPYAWALRGAALGRVVEECMDVLWEEGSRWGRACRRMRMAIYHEEHEALSRDGLVHLGAVREALDSQSPQGAVYPTETTAAFGLVHWIDKSLPEYLAGSAGGAGA